MFVIDSFLGLRGDDAAHLVFIKRLADFHLLLLALVAGGHDDAVAMPVGFLLDARQHGGKVVVHKLGHNHADNLWWRLAAVAQLLGNGVWQVVVFAGVGLDGLAALGADAGTVLKGA